jgi:long-chain acyl-CoA synthetase
MASAPLPEIHAAWNSPALAQAILRAWEDDRPIALLNPALMGLPSVDGWIRALGPALGEGLPPGFQAILLTSGTTGQPRLVALGRASVIWNTETLSRHLGLPDGQREAGLVTPLAIPLFHAFGLVLGLFLTHRRGGRLHLVPRGLGLMDGLLAAPPVDAGAHRLLLLVPAMVRGLPEPLALDPDARARLASWVGTTITGGAPVRRGDLQKLAALFPGMTHTIGYGLTEAGPALTHTAGEIPEADGGLGVPLPGVQLIPPSLADAGAGAGAGLGWSFRSPGVASAMLSAGSTVWQPIQPADPLPTGDLLEGTPCGSSDAGGYRFCGRTAWTFKKKGETLSPLWIEDALWAALAAETAEGVAPPAMLKPDGLVIAADSRPETDAILLYVEATPEPALVAGIEAAIGQLPSFVRPDRVFWLPRFPRTVLGKVERGALQSNTP